VLQEKYKATSAAKRQQSKNSGWNNDGVRGEEVKKLLEKKQSDSKYQKFQAVRRKLPAWQKREEVVSLLASSQVLIVAGETGCGKTTQCPQFILDEAIMSGNGHDCRIICTQPRRISAVGVAERVAQERAEPIGESVGYQIRLERKMGPRTRLLFMTTGILLRRLHGDPLLEGVSHVLVDEVHERSLDSDFLLIVLRDLLPKRPDLKLVLMSATINADLFSSYFGGCPVMTIPGFTHPVKEYYLEDILKLSGHRIKRGSQYAKGTGRRYDHTQAQNQRLNSRSDAARSAGGVALQKHDGTLLDEDVVASLEAQDEEKINYDVIEATVRYIGKHFTAEGDEGAILIFLPGLMEM
jgi:HrpA-like RNA helicase